MPRLTKLYLLLAALLPASSMALPFFLSGFDGAAGTAASFLATVPFALAAIGWPTLKPRDVWLVPPLAGFLAMALGALLSLIDPVPRGLPWSEALTVGLLQLPVTMIVAVGLWMRPRNAGLLVRRTASDRHELEQAYELCSASRWPPTTLFRLQRLLENSHSLSAELRADLLGVIPILLMKRELVVLEPFCANAQVALALARSVRLRIEASLVDGITLAVAEPTPWLGAIHEQGFRPIPTGDADLDHVVAVQKFLANVAEQRMLEPAYFEGFRHFYRWQAATPTKEAS